MSWEAIWLRFPIKREGGEEIRGFQHRERLLCRGLYSDSNRLNDQLERRFFSSCIPCFLMQVSKIIRHVIKSNKVVTSCSRIPPYCFFRLID